MLQTLKNYYHLLQAVQAVRQYHNPGQNLTVIGITGTDGKTTTSHLVYHLLGQTGHKTALISTIAAYIGDGELDTGFHVSTPSSKALQSYLAKAKKEGVVYVVLEVTSHALDQYRVYGIPFTVGVLTNISREHLDYHQTMERYMQAKAKLLLSAQTAIINRDDSSYDFMKKILAQKSVLTYGLHHPADVTPRTIPFRTNLLGEFNQYNILAALSVCKALNIDLQQATKALSTFQLPEGRVDVVYDNDFKVIIDFAHTPNGIKNILKSIRKDMKKGKIIHVFGSAGKRDKGKRPLMGEISHQLADRIILTSEDPRDESPESIAEDIMSGMPADKNDVRVITDRQDAITEAVCLADKNDVVVITGKGHEKSINKGHGEEPWSDHEAVVKGLEQRAKGKGRYE
ncbi:MAG TPA: UDP-N-acetylmuramoyl-L-alanyl-D-glutamate--2,6-diaminopimelate ligase [Patescibacteria group bacterium]|nr:UDP-N-acetylmuramoyl-L-alanyl-D-glutamate--2,6-diaminopimelate ligase [Patescibacteria group bacterium]